MAAQDYPSAYLGDEAGNPSYAFASTETVVDKDTGKTLKQILQEGSAGGGTVDTVDGIAPENGNVALLSPTQETPGGTPIPLDADTLQGHAADEFAKAANYSTDEQWTSEIVDFGDGPEKIYCKIFSGTMTPSNVPDTFAGAVANWKRTISVNVQVGNGERSFPYFEFSAPNQPNWPYSYTSAILQNGNLTLMHGTSIPITDFYAILKYTKTDESTGEN